MIDIHAHILPGVDDGAVDLHESMEMIRQGYEDGIRTIVAAPHVLDQVVDERLEASFREKMAELKSEALSEALDVELILGSEVYIQLDMKSLCRFEFATIGNNGRYLLLELPMMSYPQYTEHVVFELALQGITTILSHPERNLFFQENKEELYDLVYRGALVQVNAGSITGDFGPWVKRFTEELLLHNLVHFVGSDAHSSGHRPLILSEAKAMVEDLAGEEMAEALVFSNPAKAIAGEPIDPAQPMPFRKGSVGERLKAWWRGLSR